MTNTIEQCFLEHTNGSKKERFVLKINGPNFIGRKSNIVDPSINIVLDSDDQEISRKHCKIDIQLSAMDAGYIFLLSDLGSKNGTTIMNQQRKEMVLMDNDVVFLEDGYRIKLGQTEFVFRVLFNTVHTKYNY